MQRLVRFNSNITATGTYAAINAYPSSLTFASGNPQQTVPGMLVSGTLVAFSNAGTTGGVVVPVYLGPDGNYYPLATATTVSAAGVAFVFQMTAPAPGLAIQVTTTISGGSVNLFCSAVLV